MAGFMDRQSKRSHRDRSPLVRQKEKTKQAAQMTDDDVNRHERMHEKVDKDDFLLAQIDEFRKKAQKLQEMLDTKETKAKELADIVEEREIKAEELKQILDERQVKADGITAQVEHQIDILIDRVNAKMQEIEASMTDNIEGFGKNISGNIDDFTNKISVRIDDLERSVGEDISKAGSESSDMLRSLGELNNQLVALKQEISEKVHTENVKCYRNIQDLFKSMDEKVDSVYAIEKQIRSAKTFSILTFVFALINTFGLIMFSLYVCGVIDNLI